MTEEMSITFMKIGELSYKLGVRDLYKLPGAWIHKLDENWILAVNGKDRKVIAKPEGCMMCDIPPYHVAVWWNGWIAGIFNAYQGQIAAGTEANEDALIAALDKAIEEIDNDTQ